MKVLVTLITEQRFDAEAPDVSEFHTEGEYDHGETSMLLYQESELTGLGGVMTKLTIEPERVTMSRGDREDTGMVFQTGLMHHFAYATPYGMLQISVKTHSLSININEHGGNIDVRYDIIAGGELAGRNYLQINIREA